METASPPIACRVHEVDTEAMGTIQIRDVPDDVIESLKRQAQALGLSLSQFLRQELIDSAQQETWTEITARINSRERVSGLTSTAEIIREARGEI